jgi:hypothetical protein
MHREGLPVLVTDGRAVPVQGGAGIVTAAEAREELESAIWRTDPASMATVRLVLEAADRYADAVTAETLTQIEHDCSTVATRRAALTAGDGKNYGATL